MPCFIWKNRSELNMDELRRLFYGRRQNWTALYWIESNNSLILLSNVFMIIYLNSNYTHHHRLSHSFPGWSALMSRSIWRQWASIKREECDVCYWGGAWPGLARVRALRHSGDPALTLTSDQGDGWSQCHINVRPSWCQCQPENLDTQTSPAIRVCGYSLNHLTALHYCRGCHTSVIVRALLELQSSNIFWRIEGWKCVKYLVHIKYFKLGNENISIFDDLTNSHSDQNPKNWTLIQQTFLNLVYWASVTWIVTFYSQILTLDFQTSSRLPGICLRGIPK